MRLPIAIGLLALAVLVGAGAAVAGVKHKNGTYSGKTDQSKSVTDTYRKIAFKVRKGKVTLTTEPTVARGLCTSTPVFTLGGATPSAKLSKNGTFTFSSTFLGNKFDKIHGAFVSSHEIDGYAVYHFASQDLCTEGKSKVKFTAKK